MTFVLDSTVGPDFGETILDKYPCLAEFNYREPTEDGLPGSYGTISIEFAADLVRLGNKIGHKLIVGVYEYDDELWTVLEIYDGYRE